MEESENTEILEIATRVSVTELTEKVKMFLANEEECCNHPLNTRIHNPYQYVFTCDSSTLLSATRLALQKFKGIEKKLLSYLGDGGKYQVSQQPALLFKFV